MGCVTPVGEQGSDITKMIVQNADWDESVPGVQLDRFCASGLEAVNTAAQKVASGWDDLVVAGGIECMSRVPMGSNGGAMASDPAFALKTGFVPQGIGADMIATIDGYTREDVDAYAMESQRRAAHARAAGRDGAAAAGRLESSRRRDAGGSSPGGRGSGAARARVEHTTS